MRPVNDEAVFWSRVKQGQNDCWDWQGGRAKGGYGAFRLAGITVRVHRYAYELLIGEIPAGLVIDHLCRNRLCVNPYHMEPVTSVVNVMRGESIPAQNVNVTTCPQGHPYNGDNLHVDPYRGWRQCLTCRRASYRNAYRKNIDENRRKARERMAKRYASQAK